MNDHQPFAGEMMETTRFGGRTSLIVFFIALMFQIIVSQIAGLGTDPIKYEIFARNYLNGTLNPERLIDCSPLYFYFHVAVAKCIHWKYFVTIFQSLLVAGSALLLFKLAHERFSRPVAFLSVLLFITSRSIIIYTNISEPEPFMVFFLLAFLYFATRGTTRGSLMSGLCLTASLLTRSNFLPLAVVTPIFFMLTIHDRRRALRESVIFLAPVIIGLLLLMYRNSTITRSFTPFSMNPGTVFYEGNNPNSNGDSAVYPPVLFQVVYDIRDKTPDYPHVLYRDFARRLEQKDLSITEVNAFWSSKGKNFLLDHPLLSAKKWLFKAYCAFNNYRKHDIPVAYTQDTALAHSGIPTIPFALIVALALTGMVMALKEWKSNLLFYGAVFSQLLVMTVTYVSDRQRVTIIGVLLVFAAFVLDRLLRKTKPAMHLLLPVCLLTALFLYRPLVLADHQHDWERNEEMKRLRVQAKQLREKGKLQDAAEMDAACLALTPALYETIRLAGLSYPEGSFAPQAVLKARSFNDRSPSGRFDLAVLQIQAGQLDDAERALQNLVQEGLAFNRYYRQSSLPEYYLGRVAQLKGKHDEAALWLRKGLARNPGDPWILSELGALTGDQRYHDLLLRYFDGIDAAYFTGRSLLLQGKHREALAPLGLVAEKLPEFRTGRIYHSLALAGVGRYQEATREYLAAMKVRPDEIFEEQQVIRMFEEAARTGGPEARYSLGMVLQDFGHYPQALAQFRSVLTSGLPPAIVQECAGRIEWIEKVALPLGH